MLNCMDSRRKDKNLHTPSTFNYVVNNTLAISLLVISDRTSHKFVSNFLTRGRVEVVNDLIDLKINSLNKANHNY